MQPSDTLAALAAQQFGAFSVAQARAHGYRRAEIDTHLRNGKWLRPMHGICVERQVWADLDAEGRHLFKASARLLRLDPSWHLARRTAALAYGLPMLGAVPEVPQLLRPRRPGVGRASTRHEKVSPLPPQERSRAGNLRATSMAWTVVDLARTDSLRSAVVTADAALRAGVGAAALDQVLAVMAHWPGAARARRALALADHRAESAFESLSRVAMLSCGLPRPELQVEIWCAGEFLARVDFLWREQRVIGEADGRSKYTSVGDFYAEKRREERLRDLGFEVVRWDWATAWNPQGRLDRLLLRGFARAAHNTLDPAVTLAA
jgi:very-short-patch-repair endonuclease